MMDNKGKFHIVGKIRFVDNSMSVVIDGKEYSFPLKDISVRLFKAPSVARETFEIDKYGYGIHWPLVDEDLSIKGLLRSAKRTQKRRTKVTV